MAVYGSMEASMRFDKEVIREIKKMALGCAVCSVLCAAVFAVIGQFDLSVLIGAAVGFLLSFGNFFFMSLGVIKALETGDEAAAKLKMHSSYIARTVVMLAVMALSIIVDFIHWVPVLVSVFYPRIVLTAQPSRNTSTASFMLSGTPVNAASFLWTVSGTSRVS